MERTRALPFFWDQVEPNHLLNEQGGRAPHSCYSTQLKADLLPGTFVLIAPANVGGTSGDVVARILKAVGSCPSFAVEVNIFKNISDVTGSREGILMLPQTVGENHLKHLPEVVQTMEVLVVPMTDVTNLAFVFTEASLQDASNFFFTCQGMSLAFLLRFRVSPSEDSSEQNNEEGVLLTKMPLEYCLPFPSCYKDSKYFDCFARRIWNNIVLVKLEMMKLLGRYSQQQGLYGRECSRLYLTAETWGFICLQCVNIFSASDFGSSKRVRLHRIVESGLVVKAARVQKTCAVMRFSTKRELKGLCRIFGESVTAGQRCRLPKISAPKSLWINDVINVVCGSDDTGETGFSSRTAQDGIDLEFDGLNEMFLTIRYTRYAYTRTSLDLTERCDPLLSSLICHANPYKNNDGELLVEEIHQTILNDNDYHAIVDESEFEDDGCLYRVTSINSTHVNATCIYPKRNNEMHGCTKSFDLALAKELIKHRLSG